MTGKTGPAVPHARDIVDTLEFEERNEKLRQIYSGKGDIPDWDYIEWYSKNSEELLRKTALSRISSSDELSEEVLNSMQRLRNVAKREKWYAAAFFKGFATSRKDFRLKLESGELPSVFELFQADRKRFLRRFDDFCETMMVDRDAVVTADRTIESSSGPSYRSTIDLVYEDQLPNLDTSNVLLSIVPGRSFSDRHKLEAIACLRAAESSGLVEQVDRAEVLEIDLEPERSWRVHSPVESISNRHTGSEWFLSDMEDRARWSRWRGSEQMLRVFKRAAEDY